MDEKPKVTEKKQTTVPESSDAKKGVGFSEPKAEENDRAVADGEEVSCFKLGGKTEVWNSLLGFL